MKIIDIEKINAVIIIKFKKIGSIVLIIFQRKKFISVDIK